MRNVVAPRGADERIDGLPEHVTSQQEERCQSAEDVQEPLKEQVGQRMRHGVREEWDEHSVTIEFPLKRSPVLQADEHRQQRVAIVQAVERPEVDREGGDGTEEQRDADPLLLTLAWQRLVHGVLQDRLSSEGAAAQAKTRSTSDSASVTPGPSVSVAWPGRTRWITWPPAWSV